MVSHPAASAHGKVISDKSALFGTYKRLFLNPIRRDRFGIKNDQWVTVNAPLKDFHFHEHLSGRQIVGFSFIESESGLVAFDIDNHTGDQVKADRECDALVRTIERETGRLPIVEQSVRNGGYHVFVPLMNGRYAEYARKIKLFAKHIMHQAGITCEVFGAGMKTGNFRAPFSKDYTLINPFTGQSTGLTGYDAIDTMLNWLRADVYIHGHRIELETIPEQIHREAVRQRQEINDRAAFQVYQTMRTGLTGPRQRIRTLRAIFWYLTEYHGNPTARAVRYLEYWIRTKHNGNSRDINSDYAAGINDSDQYIRALECKQDDYIGSPFYFTNSTGQALSVDGRLLASHLLDLVHHCAVTPSYLSAHGFKIGREYWVTIPYSNAVRARMAGFKDRRNGKAKRMRAELELEGLALSFVDRQLNLFLPPRSGSPCTHRAVNVQALYGYRSGRDVWTKYKDKMHNDQAVRWLTESSKDYSQSELAQIIGVGQQTISRWIKSRRIPAKYHFTLYELRQI